MEQRSIVLYLHLHIYLYLYLARKRLQQLAIHRDIVATLGPEAVSYSSVTRYLSDAVLSSSNSVPHLPEQERKLDDCDQAILHAFAEQPFASIRELSQLAQLP
jgi:hypothetical protein